MPRAFERASNMVLVHQATRRDIAEMLRAAAFKGVLVKCFMYVAQLIAEKIGLKELD
jgi:hypothetical protein